MKLPAELQFDTVLVANRGEIAVRVMRTARRMGLRTVAVFSDADADSPHVLAADLAIHIGRPEANESYLRVDRIIEAALRSGAGAIHPGYGFLSERAHFARACDDAGLVFVGPPASAIDAMGDKAAAKLRMREAGVPVVPGYEGEQDDAVLVAQAHLVGFPVMVKACAGGGGKGMRLVETPQALPAALAAARREAASAFGNDHLLLERAIQGPRHVEIQVLADRYGHVIHLGERDCSVQRRHQKVVEEAPSPAVDAALRAAMGEAAVRAARSVDYVGAGTVEFLLDSSGAFYFLEMNTRLQVEHAVTELVTGLDLVAWQLRIARGEPLTLQQEQVPLQGHAIEVRLYAEDPARDYLPSTGRVALWQPPVGEGVRVDAGIRQGGEITAHYDPMIAKIVGHGRDRDEARARLIRALEDTRILGPTTNRAMLLATLREDAFAAGQATTAFLQQMPTVPGLTSADLAAIAAWRHGKARRVASKRDPGLAGWSSSGPLQHLQRLAIGSARHQISITENARGAVPDAWQVRVDGHLHHVACEGDAVTVDGVKREIHGVVLSAERCLMSLPALDVDVRDLFQAAPDNGIVAGKGVLIAPMHGKVIVVEAVLGQTVRKGQRLAALEAMKMEHAIVADMDGVLEELVGLGLQVATGQILARIRAADAA